MTLLPTTADRDIPHLTDTYHKARRNLGIASSVFLGWEFIGVVLGEEKTVDDQTELVASGKVPFFDFPAQIQSPEVVPYLILILVGFFSWRFALEWSQCDADRRSQWAAKWDFRSTMALAVAAVGLFVFQTISNVRVADFLKFAPLSASVGFGVSALALVAAVITSQKILEKISGSRFYKNMSSLSRFFFRLFALAATFTLFYLAFVFPISMALYWIF